jgi:uncharacterized membrane protein YfcA
MRGTIRSIFEKHRRAVLFLVGIAGGFLSGLLGAGGGIIFIFALRYLLGGEEGERGVFAMSLLAVFFTSVATFLFYTAGSAQIPEGALGYILPAVCGGVCGALLLFLIDPIWLRLLFGAVVVYSGVMMLL